MFSNVPTKRRLDTLKRRRGVMSFVAALALSAVAWPSQASATVGTPKYPDLRAMPPINLNLGEIMVGDQHHQVVRFTARTYNGGPGALEIRRTPQVIPASGLAELTQRIYEDPAGFRDEKLGAIPLNPTFTFVIPDAARYELWARRTFTWAQIAGFKRGRPLIAKPDVSYCVRDSQQIDPNATPAPGVPGTYTDCTAAIQGISPGWADIQPWNNDNQALDVGTTPLPDGKYVLRVIADPDNLLWESPGKSDPAREGQVANQGYSSFDIVKGAITWNG
jgi:hypothetical protein